MTTDVYVYLVERWGAEHDGKVLTAHATEAAARAAAQALPQPVEVPGRWIEEAIAADPPSMEEGVEVVARYTWLPTGRETIRTEGVDVVRMVVQP